ncbi:hypothetical protein BaRGS_00017171 [Batillaria attramentaria]|uniref:Uncharacterized protein n=1 Tax=Batillaria attramentaria TaxID=370345 RepID=A0ABD0KXN6_9CAEN
MKVIRKGVTKTNVCLLSGLTLLAYWLLKRPVAALLNARVPKRLCLANKVQRMSESETQISWDSAMQSASIATGTLCSLIPLCQGADFDIKTGTALF